MAAPSTNVPSVAGPALINTAELREMILIHVEPKTLLLAQRVSKNFKATIDESDDIQRKLFFKRDTALPLIKRTRLGEEAINPILFQQHQCTSHECKSGLLHNSRYKGFGVVHRIPNFRVKTGLLLFPTHFHFYVLESALPEAPKSSSIQESWRKMYPFLSGFAAQTEHAMLSDWKDPTFTNPSDSYTMGQLFDKIASSRLLHLQPNDLPCEIKGLREHGENYSHVEELWKHYDWRNGGHDWECEGRKPEHACACR